MRAVTRRSAHLREFKEPSWSQSKRRQHGPSTEPTSSSTQLPSIVLPGLKLFGNWISTSR